MPELDLGSVGLRAVNAELQALRAPTNAVHWRILRPRGAHALAVGLAAPVTVEIDGPAGYYCAGMNAQATVVVHGSVGTGVAENMMSGEVRVRGDASQSAGASGQGGLLVIDGDASARCGIAMKGIDIVVKGGVGHMAAFMGQAGSLAVLGDVGDAMGDSLYEARLYVRGRVASLGADCILKRLTDHHRDKLGRLLERAGLAGEVDPAEFRRYGSARNLYHFHVDNAGAY